MRMSGAALPSLRTLMSEEPSLIWCAGNNYFSCVIAAFLLTDNHTHFSGPRSPGTTHIEDVVTVAAKYKGLE